MVLCFDYPELTEEELQDIEMNHIEYIIDKNSDFWCGIESGFPLCCIDFYINFWNPVRESKKMFSGRPECYDWKKGVGYVQCPECIIKGMTKLTDCE